MNSPFSCFYQICAYIFCFLLFIFYSLNINVFSNIQHNFSILYVFRHIIAEKNFFVHRIGTKRIKNGMNMHFLTFFLTVF